VSAPRDPVDKPLWPVRAGLAVCTFVYLLYSSFGICAPFWWGHHGYHGATYMLRARMSLRLHMLSPATWGGFEKPPLAALYFHHPIGYHHLLTLLIPIFGDHEWLARGVAVAGMLVVEQLPAGPGGYPWLRHALWNGWTGADLVFPAFLFLVGISVDQLVGRRGRAGLWRLVKRAVALIVVGVLFNAWAADGADFAQARWPGVLQRIGVVSLTCGVIVFVVRRNERSK